MRSPITHIETEASEVFLTFDDGPDRHTTEAVLKVLDKFDARATFFVIGEKAQNHKSLLGEVKSQGHCFGNHSWDHGYSHYFHKKQHLKSWVLDSQKRLSDILGEEPVAFRSPAGIVTPPLKQAMGEISLPWVHWSRRFFDTNVPLAWTLPWCEFKRGDIVLLHDSQKSLLQSSFLKSLEGLVGKLRDKGFDIHPLNKERFIHDC